MSERAQDMLAKVLLELPGVCQDAEAVREAPSLQCAWEGSLDWTLDPRLWWWFIDAFESPEEGIRIRRAADEIRSVFLDLAKITQALTGETSVLPEALIRCLERRIVCKLKPSAYKVATGAVKHPYARASANLKKFTTEESWREKS